MVYCPNCQHKELPGALFCSECGAQLIQSQRLSSDDLVESANSPRFSQTPPPPMPAGATDSQLNLYLIDNGQMIPLSGRTEFTLGRVAEGQPILPDVDFSTFGAYSQGVSRLHAAIRVNGKQIQVIDLGSSNGTRINGQKITPNINHPIKSGDILALGKLKIQVLVRS